MFKKYIGIMMLILIIASCMSFTFSNSETKKSSISNYITVKEIKEKSPPTRVNMGFEGYDLGNLYQKSNVIVKAKLMKIREFAFIEYANSKVKKTVYKRLLTIKVSKIFKKEKAIKGVNEDSVLTVFSDSSSYNLYDESIKPEVNKEYLLFLSTAKDDGLVKYTKYGSYNINSPSWAIGLIENNNLFFDSHLDDFKYGAELVRSVDGYFRRTIYKTDNFEEPLINIIRENSPEDKGFGNRFPGIGKLSVNNVNNINIEEDKYTGVPEIKSILDYINNVSTSYKLDEKVGKQSAPAGGTPVTVSIDYKDGIELKTEIISLYDIGFVEDFTFDKFNNVIYKRYYKVPEHNLAYNLKYICDEINDSKVNNTQPNIKTIDSNKIMSLSISNFIKRSKEIKDKNKMKPVLMMLSSLVLTPTSEKIGNEATMEVVITYMSGEVTKRENYYFTSKLMKYKAYDKNNKLINFGFYDLDKDILKEIENIVHEK
jgi:hypothetical protein